MFLVTELRAHERFAGRMGTARWGVAEGRGWGRAGAEAHRKGLGVPHRGICALDCGERAP